MKDIPSTRSTAGAVGAKVDRRGLMVGAGAAGLAVVATHALRGAAIETPVAVAGTALPREHAGYQATPHVLRYYETAKS
jgi:hypothetical protein